MFRKISILSLMLMFFLANKIYCQKVLEEDEIYEDETPKVITNVPNIHSGSFQFFVPPENGLKVVSVSDTGILRLELSYSEGSCQLAVIQIKYYRDSGDMKFDHDLLDTMASEQMYQSSGKGLDKENIYYKISDLSSKEKQFSKTIGFKRYSSIYREDPDRFRKALAMSIAIDIILTPLTGIVVYPNPVVFSGQAQKQADGKWLGYVISNYQLINSLDEKGVINVLLQTYLTSDKLIHVMDYLIHSIRTGVNWKTSIEPYIKYDDAVCSITLSTGERVKGYIDKIDDRFVMYRKSVLQDQISMNKKFVRTIVCGKDTSFFEK